MIKPFHAILLVALICHGSVVFAEQLDELFSDQKLTQHDSILITSAASNKVLYDWQANQPLVPASLVKLATSWSAIEQWGLDKRFITEFGRSGSTLWVKGFGDPFLVSEELELIASKIADQNLDLTWVKQIGVDNTHFKDQVVPGRSKAADPYNAPLSALAINFNTAQLANKNGRIIASEAQTPLTKAAVLAATQLGRPANGKRERVNLMSLELASSNAAELILHKLALPIETPTTVGAQPESTQLVYRHHSSRTLADVVQGMLEYSNNFMANQVFLMLANKQRASFDDAASQFKRRAQSALSWSDFSVVEGAGLSRANRLSAVQINQLLRKLAPHKALLKKYEVAGVPVYAKTGTLNGVRSFAGYILLNAEEYQFVFNFNRTVPYRYREVLLKELILELKQSTKRTVATH